MPDIPIRIRLDSQQAEEASRRVKRELSGIGQEADKADKEIREASQGMSLMAKAAGVIAGAGLVLTLKNLALSAASYADQLFDTAAQVGLTTDELQALVYVGQDVGFSQQQLSQAIVVFQRTVGDAAAGVQQAARAFQTLGISIYDSEGALRPTRELLVEVAQALMLVPNASRQAAIGADLFGRSGGRLIPLLRDVAGGLDELITTADEAGQVMSEETAKRLDDAVLMWERFKNRITIITGEVLGAIMEVVEDTAARQQELSENFNAGVTSAVEDARILQERLDSVNEELERYGVGLDVDTEGHTSLALVAINALLEEQYRILARINELSSAVTIEPALGGLAPTTSPTIPPPPTRSSRDPAKEMIEDLQFEAEQLNRTSVAQEVYNNLRQAEIGLKNLTVAANGDLLGSYSLEAEKIAELTQLIYERAGAEERERAVRDAQRTIGDLEGEIAALTMGEQAWTDYQNARGLREDVESFREGLLAETEGLTNQAAIVEELTARYQQLVGMKQRAQTEAEKLARDTDAVRDAAKEMGREMVSAFTDIVFHAGSVEEALLRILDRLADILLQLAFGAEGFEGFFGDVVMGALDWAGGLFGGPSFAPGVGPNGMGFTTFGGPRAGGGDVFARNSYLVGEKGPERFIPDSNGQIVPLDRSSSPIFNIEINVATEGGGRNEDEQERAKRLGEALWRELRGRIVEVIVDQKRPGNSLNPGMF